MAVRGKKPTVQLSKTQQGMIIAGFLFIPPLLGGWHWLAMTCLICLLYLVDWDTINRRY